MEKKEIVALLLKRVDVKGLLVEDLLGAILKPALDKMVADSANPYDDVAVAALYPPLAKAIEEQVAALLAKIQE